MRTIMIVGLSLLTATVGFTLIVWGWADAKASRRHRRILEVRDWQDTVAAMRRMANEEGAA